MPEMIAAHITIGGEFPNKLVHELCQAISDECLGLDWSALQFTPTSAADLLKARTCQGQSLHLKLYADSASWGRFPALEALLIEQRIPFDRYHDTKFEIASTVLIYRPEIEPMEFLTDSQERIVTPAGPLMPIAKMLVQAQADLRKGRGDEAGNLIAECLQKLQEHLPPELPPLPIFTIGG